MTVQKEEMNKDQRYRESHKEQCRESTMRSYYKYHELNLERKRQQYIANKENILAKARLERADCHLCAKNFNGKYLWVHLKNKHCLSADEIARMRVLKNMR